MLTYPLAAAPVTASESLIYIEINNINNNLKLIKKQ